VLKKVGFYAYKYQENRKEKLKKKSLGQKFEKKMKILFQDEKLWVLSKNTFLANS